MKNLASPTSSLTSQRRLWWLAAIIFVFGLAIRLPALSNPHAIVFDEVYFGKFATAYCCGHDNFFDIHPPHAKLLIAAAGKVFGTNSGFGFEYLGQEYEKNVSIFGLRFAPAVMGALVPALAMLLIVQLGGSVGLAFVGGMLLALDNALWVQSRIIALDATLIAATLGAFCLLLVALRRTDMRSRAVFLFLAGGSAGMAVGTKFTGMACLPIMGLLLLQAAVQSAMRHERRPWLLLVRHSVWIAAGFVVVYLSGWWLHFLLLTKPGAGDPFFVPTRHFLADIVRLHQIMLEKNASILTPHAYGSKAYTWPIMRRPVFYWSSGHGVIYLLGNPVVWYGTLLAFIAVIGRYLGRASMGLAQGAWTIRPKLGIWMPFLTCVVCYVPLLAVSRPLFLYHYFTTLVFMVIFVCLALEQPYNVLKTKWPQAWPVRHLGLIVIILAIIGYVAMLPMTSGAGFGVEYRDMVYGWMPTWR